jgi:hypothetical protein
MWKTIHSMPVLAKVFIVVLILASVVTLARLNHHHARVYRSADFRQAGERGGDESSDSTARRASGASVRESTRETAREASDESGRQLAAFKAQQTQLMARVYQCEREMTQATNEMGAAAMRGQMVNNRPQCEQYMPQWTAQEAYLETEIYRIQTGDRTSSLRTITGIPGDSDSSSRPSRGSDDGTGAVEDWDRGAIRGTSIYTDGDGGRHELPTRSYYFRDRASGQIIGSDQSSAPNDGRDYEQLQNAGPQ